MAKKWGFGNTSINRANFLAEAWSGRRYPAMLTPPIDGRERDARMRKVQGVAIVSAVIDESGNFGDFKVIKNLSGGCTEEVIGALSELPKYWIPATSTDGPVASKMLFAVTFGIEGKYKIRKSDVKKFPVLAQDKPYVIPGDVRSFSIIRR